MTHGSHFTPHIGALGGSVPHFFKTIQSNFQEIQFDGFLETAMQP
jgi:hypothetical protein